MPKIHDTRANKKPCNLVFPSNNKEKMITFPQKDQQIFPILSIKIKIPNIIIPSSKFELIKFENMDFSWSKISIILEENKNLCYEYFHNKLGNYFACDACLKKKLINKAILIDFDNGQSFNNNKFIQVDETPHICEPRIYKPYIRKNNIIKKGGFIQKHKLQPGLLTKVLIIYDDSEMELCRIFTYEKNTKKFICTKCTKNKMFAFLHEPLGEEVYVQLGYGEHDCEPLKYSELYSEMDNNKYISYWDVACKNLNPPLLSVYEVGEILSATVKAAQVDNRIPTNKSLLNQKKPFAVPTSQKDSSSNDLLLLSVSDNDNFGCCSTSEIKSIQDSELSIIDKEGIGNNINLDLSVANNRNTNDPKTVENEKKSNVSKIPNDDDFWDFLDSHENSMETNIEIIHQNVGPTNCIFYSKSKLPLIRKRKYTNLYPVSSKSANSNCTFYSKRKKASQPGFVNGDSCNIMEGSSSTTLDNAVSKNARSVSLIYEKNIQNYLATRNALTQKHSNYVSPDINNDFDNSFEQQNNDFELNGFSNNHGNNNFSESINSIDGRHPKPHLSSLFSPSIMKSIGKYLENTPTKTSRLLKSRINQEKTSSTLSSDTDGESSSSINEIEKFVDYPPLKNFTPIKPHRKEIVSYESISASKSSKNSISNIIDNLINSFLRPHEASEMRMQTKNRKNYNSFMNQETIIHTDVIYLNNLAAALPKNNSSLKDSSSPSSSCSKNSKSLVSKQQTKVAHDVFQEQSTKFRNISFEKSPNKKAVSNFSTLLKPSSSSTTIPINIYTVMTFDNEQQQIQNPSLHTKNDSQNQQQQISLKSIPTHNFIFSSRTNHHPSQPPPPQDQNYKYSFKINLDGQKELHVLHLTKLDHYYKFINNNQKNIYDCENCNKLGCFVSAVICKNNENNKNFIKVYGNHVCQAAHIFSNYV